MQLDVRPFSDTSLYDALQSPEQKSRDEVLTHRQARYLHGYLKDIGAKCILVEESYTDGDYLDDYATYYVKSFRHYERRCRRLHFFDQSWDAAALAALLVEPEPRTALQDAYLGFIVRRPLPDAIIGRTALKTYPNDKGLRGTRFYPTRRTYDVHLYGTKLAVDSLAFQEQDTVLAACATVSLWSAFHKTKDLFGTAAPSPAEITRAATSGIIDSRPFPSKGLIVPQIAHAIRSIGLEPELFECDGSLPLLSLLVGYVSLGIPPILGIDIQNVGLHAVAVTGYSLRNGAVHPFEDTAEAPPQRIGLRVDELYVHDDGHGPFARIIAMAEKPETAEEPVITFTGEWQDPKGKGTLARLTPRFVIIPVYHKIRLSFIDVQQWITQFGWIVNKVFATPVDTEWEVTLTTTNDVKHGVKGGSLEGPEVERVLLEPQPRFLWRALMRVGQAAVLEVLFDATGMLRSQNAFDILFHVPEMRSHFAKVIHLARWETEIERTILRFLRERVPNDA